MGGEAKSGQAMEAERLYQTPHRLPGSQVPRHPLEGYQLAHHCRQGAEALCGFSRDSQTDKLQKQSR